ncbi:actin-related protein 5-like [Oscarella lobularis]|uniref:actin-related protein 5-like n=1 Tax=Oscarella lobularis TaxID=121494 RepID=UPI003313263F
MSESERCYRFEDCCSSPDPFFEDYDEYEGSEVPVVIDNGGYQCKAGWAGESQPKLIFRNVTAKSKKKREFDASTVGSDIGNLETVRWALRSQFDNVVTHFETQELVFDHVFSRSGIATENFVDHPVVLTEPVCIPDYCRGMMSELLFECYGVPSVAYGIDALFGLHFNQKPPNSVDSLVVSCGYQTTHILPVLKGRLDASQCKRINVGGSHIAWFLQRLLQLKHPAHQQVVTLSRAEELIHRYAYMALDFAEELNKWQNPNQMIDRIIKMQLPYTPIPVLDREAAALKEEREKEKKARQGQRLQEMAARKRHEKLEENERQLEGWLSLLALRNSDPDQFERLLSHFGFDSADVR